MNQLPLYVEYLLFEHDRVVVPTLGTFAVHRRPMQRDDEGMFLVPRRDVSFTPMWDDDDTLAQCVAHRLRCGMTEAGKRIEQWVAECRMAANECGVCDMDVLGLFIMRDEQMEFQPCTAGLTSPQYFGLDNLEMPLLPILTSQIIDAVERETANDEATDTNARHIVIRLNRTFVHYAASVAASVLLFLTFSTTATNTECTHEASMAPSFFLPTHEQSNNEEQMEPVVIDEAASVEEEVVAEDATQETVEPAPVVEAPQAGYAVVVASSIRRVNAEAMVERLKSRGIEGAQVFEHKGTLRVAFMGYTSQQEANAAAAQLRTKDSELSGAWVYAIK